MNTFNFSALKRYALRPLLKGLGIVALVACNAQPAPDLQAASSAENKPGTLTQNSTASSNTADLNNDSLIAPSEPVLEITASAGELALSWSERDNTQIVSIYRHDASKGLEKRLDIDIDPSSTQLSLPSQTHLSAWHRVQYRVELCSDTDCVSSQRVAILGLAEQTLTHVRPAVFIKNEPYAQDIAINENASVFAVTRPLEGSIDIYIASVNQWLMTQHLRLNGLTLSTTRQIQLSASANGNVIAALISDSSTQDKAQIRILERLGEAWIETQQLPMNLLDNTSLSSGMAITASPQVTLTAQRSLQLSSQGDRLLLRINNNVALYAQGPLGWARIASLGEPITATEKTAAENSEQNPPPDVFSTNPSVTMSLLAVSASASLHRLFTLHEKEQQLWVTQWLESTEQDLPTHWQPGTSILVSGIDASHDIHLKSTEQGDRIAIAGWEDTRLTLRTPVMWRFSVHPIDSTLPVSNNVLTPALNVIDSLRLSPTRQAQASLRFTSDSNLENLAFGWQSEENADTGALADAHLITYSYHTPTRQWLTAMELPEAIPTLAKQNFVGKVVMAADGNTLLLGSVGFTSTSTINANNSEVLVFH